MRLIPSDTSIEAIQKQFEILRQIGIEGRAEMVFELSDNLRQITEAGIKLRHPEYSEQDIRQEVLRVTLGEEQYHKVFEGQNDRR